MEADDRVAIVHTVRALNNIKFAFYSVNALYVEFFNGVTDKYPCSEQVGLLLEKLVGKVP